MPVSNSERDAIIAEIRRYFKIHRLEAGPYLGYLDGYDFIQHMEHYLTEHTEWECRYCRTTNPGNYNVCQSCKYEKHALPTEPTEEQKI
jgi:hypothetical protein